MGDADLSVVLANPELKSDVLEAVKPTEGAIFQVQDRCVLMICLRDNAQD